MMSQNLTTKEGKWPVKNTLKHIHNTKSTSQISLFNREIVYTMTLSIINIAIITKLALINATKKN